MTRGLARALAGFALLLGGLLALVALASRDHDPGGGAGGGGGGTAVPAGVFGYVYALFLVGGAVAVPFFFYVYARETAPSRRRRRRSWLLPLALPVVAGIALLVTWQAGPQLAAALEQLRFWDAESAAGDAATRPRPPAPEWRAVAAMSTLAILGAGAFAAGHALRRRRSLPGREAVAEALSSALDDTLDDLRAEADARRAIILAYARMEGALDAGGVPRDECEAPLEYLARVLLELDVAPEPVGVLTGLFERAKFSRHALGADAKDEAISALEAIRSRLRELA